MKREKIIQLPKIIDERGNLSFIEAGLHLPFNIARAYWVYDVPGGQKRGSHAFRQQHELIVALSGSFDVVLDDGQQRRAYTLNRAFKALYVPNMMWRSLENFSTNSLCLVIASEPYSKKDYIRSYKKFRSELALSSFRKKKYEILKPSGDNRPQYSTIADCKLLEFPTIKNRAGNITPVHGRADIPFAIERAFYIYDIPSGVSRGMHAHKCCHEVLVATSGSFDVELDDGVDKKTITLNHPKYGLHIPPGVWATEKNYSAGAICVAFTSESYDADDYIYTYDDFIKYRADES